MGDERNATIWQQGFVLDSKDAVELGLLTDAEVADKIALVVSHDCDLIEGAELEPTCEVIVGRKIDRLDGTFANAKNPRRLHLTLSAGTEKLVVELSANDKRTIDKAHLLVKQPVAQVRPSLSEIWALQSWLAVRYFRPSYPDEFDRRLKAKPAEVHKRISNAIKATGTDLVAVLFDIDSGKPDAEKGADDVYVLGIFLLYDVSQDPARALETAKKAAQSITGVFRQYFFQGGQWRGIELRSCVPVSEDALTVYQWRMMRLWYFDAFSLTAKKPTEAEEKLAEAKPIEAEKKTHEAG